jgi:hypothetical protein
MSSSDEARKEQARRRAEELRQRREAIVQAMRRDVRLFESIIRGPKGRKVR